ncbi:hypothetical protein GRAN_0048 [Granulicella sibirica]|uniref:Uncharacterized protein n=1 Tax=Granulicella sibirica TaxID=2479048 RepID=A0A4Q0T3X9_9BACT|nr:hypothetical protein GRAN_0048 [Granulicella sibirica]
MPFALHQSAPKGAPSSPTTPPSAKVGDPNRPTPRPGRCPCRCRSSCHSRRESASAFRTPPISPDQGAPSSPTAPPSAKVGDPNRPTAGRCPCPCRSGCHSRRESAFALPLRPPAPEP